MLNAVAVVWLLAAWIRRNRSCPQGPQSFPQGRKAAGFNCQAVQPASGVALDVVVGVSTGLWAAGSAGQWTFEAGKPRRARRP
eukprot:COSAG01_NODE_1857_length_9044_cov_24.006931_2_plen_83_part_00